MRQPGADVLRAVSSLANNPNFTVISEWLQDSLLHQSVQNNFTDDPNFRIMQGRNREISDILKIFKGAKELLDRMNAQSKESPSQIQ